MRQVGEITGLKRAERFRAFLAKEGIESELREDEADKYRIWVFEEDQVAAADEHFRAFKIAPDAAVFDAPVLTTAKKERPDTQPRNRYIDVRTEVFGRSRIGSLPITLALIAFSVVLTLMGEMPGVKQNLLFSWPLIVNGEVWRIVTPIFIHGGIWHLLFNMLWLYQLGGAIEIHEGRIYALVLVLVVAVIVNSAQYLVSGPYFLGMSGVVYALFGYVWLMSRHQASTPYFMARETVMIMLFWLGICLIPGLMPGVANTEHLVGLGTGALWGYLRSGAIPAGRRRRKYRGKL